MASVEAPSAGSPRRSALRRVGRSEWLWGVLFAAPAVVLIVYFVAYPVGTVVYYGFTRWNGLSRKPTYSMPMRRPDALVSGS